MPAVRPATTVIALLLAAVAAVLLLSGRDAAPARAAASAGQLQSAIAGAKSRESMLSGQIARLRTLEQRAQKAVDLLQGRLSEAQVELDRAQARLDDTETRLRAARARHVRLRTRLAQVRTKLADVLRARYEAGRLDWTDVVLQSQNFSTLMERMEFLRRIQDSDAAVLDEVRDAKIDALKERRQYAKLLPGRIAAEADVRERRDALAQIGAGLESRRRALTQARTVRLNALYASRANRRGAEKRLTKVLAEQERAAARAAVSKAGPGGPWAIPWAIVQCESGGRNTGPNYLGASGYYQFMPATWKGLGGSTPAAYMASKAEQDRLAARLWDNGRGAWNWDCAAIVGYRR